VRVTALAVVAASAASPRCEERVAYQPAPARRPVPVSAEHGRVEKTSYMQTAARPSGAGAAVGAVLGGVIGYQVGGGVGKGMAPGAIGGAI
jgi:uncharacterized protein YcfJ